MTAQKLMPSPKKKTSFGIVLLVIAGIILLCVAIGIAAGNAGKKTQADAISTKTAEAVAPTVEKGSQKASAIPSPSATTRPTKSATITPTTKPTNTLVPTVASSPTPADTAEPTATTLPTAEPTQEATIEPTTEPTAEPTQEPTIAPTSEPSALFLDISSVTSPIAKGSYAKLVAKTLPGASCQIAVHLKTVDSSADGLEPKSADGNGDVSWSWKVAGNTSSGDWSITVAASKDGQSVTKDTPFTVQ